MKSSGKSDILIDLSERSYRVERAAGVAGPWSSIATQVAPLNEVDNFLDSDPLPGQAFYRTATP